jgi:hypothetical protein
MIPIITIEREFRCGGSAIRFDEHGPFERASILCKRSQFKKD